MFKKNAGFSLIELSVIITLFGLAVGIFSTQFSHYMNIKAANDTMARRDLIKQAFSRYLVLWHGLPCPSSPSLSPTDPSAGVADCSIAHMNPNTWPKCDNHDICVIAGARATQNNPTYCPQPAQVTFPQVPCPGPAQATAPFSALYNDPVLTGTIPYIDLGLALNDTMDGWGNRMTYAVSYYLAYDPGNPAQPAFNRDNGVISEEVYDATNDIILPKKNTNTSQGPANPVANAFMLAIVSHGPDGKGAWNYGGLKMVSCDMTVIDKGPASASPTSTGRDNENCNGDSTFLSDNDRTLHALVAGPYFYDDAFVQTDISLYADKWLALAQPNLIQNASGGSVGIGTATPTDTLNPGSSILDVKGNIRTPAIRASTFCDKNTGNCFDQSLFFPGNDCGGAAMTGIASSAPLCQQLINATALTPGTCPATQYVSGIDANGNITCQNLP
jgi:hypothetical protein